MTPSDLHNKAARDFLFDVAAKARTDAEMMVVVESMILTTLQLLHRQHHLPPATSAAMVESAVQTALERFVAVQGIGK